jgi:excisionase family DNA binding protein
MLLFSTPACSRRPEVNARMTPRDVAERLHVGTRAVYTMLEQGIIPGIRIGQRWLITRHAYEEWERTCGLRVSPDVPQATGLSGKPEVTVN